MRPTIRFMALVMSWSFFIPPSSGLAQQTELAQVTAEEQRDQLANERFEAILRKRPRAGTALERVYEYHLSRGSLDDFCAQLQTEVTQSSRGESALLLGLIQSQRGNDADAKAAFEKAEELLTAEPLASYYHGRALLLIGDNAGAIAALQRAIDRKPERADSLPIFQELGRVYQRLHRADDALKIWQRMEAMFPGDAQVQEQIANILEEEGAHEAALERFTNLASSTKDRFRQVELGVRAAAIKIKLNQHNAAVSDFEKLLAQINPGSWLYVDIRRRIDQSFLIREDLAGLTSYYHRWVDNHPQDIDAMLRVGRLHANAHNSSAARTWFQRAIDLAPSAVEPRLALVELLERDGNTSAAANAMQALSELQPNNPDYLVRWGELLLADYSQPEQQRSAAAADVWRRMLDKHHDDPVMVSRVADLMRGAHLSDEAVKLYTRAVELADNEPQYREYLGEYLHRLGRKSEAIKVWRELADGPRKNRENLVRLSEVLSTFGHAEEALNILGEACQMQPTLAERLRYCEKLVSAARFADAFNQLPLATAQARTEEERDQVLEQEIKALLASGQLSQRIEELESQMAEGSQAKSAETWKRLALYQERDGKTQPASHSINEALQLEPHSATLLSIAARIEERSGLMGDAVSTLRKLVMVDRRGQSRILMQIASLQVRLGRMEDAVRTAKEMLATPGAGTEQYRYFADLCFQSGQVEQGLEALRRNLRANPNDRDAIELLARALSNQFQTAEAIELTWRSFTKANTRAEKLQNIQTLTELYLRSGSLDDLVKRLETYGRQENRAREAILMTAAAHQASGDLATARQLLEPLLQADSRDGELLALLVELARVDGDWDAAAEYQTKLNNLSPSPEGGMQLAKFLLEKGDIEQAESIWSKFAGQKMSVEDVQYNMRQLLLDGQTDKVLSMVQRTLETNPDDWESLTLCMMMLYQCQQPSQSQQVAEKILKLNIPPDTLSERAKRKNSKQANVSSPSSGSNFGATTPTSNDVDRLSSVTRASQIIASLTAPQLMSSTSSRSPRQPGDLSPVCFSDAKYMAVYFQNPSEHNKLQDTQLIDQLIQQESSVERLWEVAFVLAAIQSTQQRFGMLSSFPYAAPMTVRSANGTLIRMGGVSTISPMIPALKRLAELDDEQAQLALINEALSQRQAIQALTAVGPGVVLNSNVIAENANPSATVLEQQLSWLRKAQDKPALAQNSRVIELAIHLAADLRDAGRIDESRPLLAFAKEHAMVAPNMSYAIACLRVDVDTAIDLFVAAHKRTSTTSVSNVLPQTFASESLQFVSQVFDRPRAIAGLETASASAEINRTNPLRLITELKKVQAEKARRMRPSQLSAYAPANVIRTVVPNGSRGTQMLQIAFPAPSALQSSELLLAMYTVFQYPNNLYYEDMEKHLFAEAAQADDDAMLSAIDHLCLSIWLCWDGRSTAALKEMEAVRNTGVANDLVCMLSSRMYYEAKQFNEAIAQLQTLKPTTPQLLQERELAILQLASESQNTELVEQTVERLIAMRLPTNLQQPVAGALLQMGQREAAAKILQNVQQRSQRNASNSLASMVQKMLALQRENNTTSATEIARQILRRTRPSRSGMPPALGTFTPNSATARNSSNSFRQQALQVLVKAPETKELIAGLEEKVRNNPRSNSLAEQLAELYEATGKSVEAAKLRESQQSSSQSASESYINSRLTTLRQTRAADSTKVYLEIFGQHPELLDREFIYFRNAIQQHRTWDLVATTLADWPAEKFANSKQWPELTRQTVANSSRPVAEKLAQKLMQQENFETVYISAFAGPNQAPWSAEFQELFVDKLAKSFGDPKALDDYVSAHSNNSSLLQALNNTVTNPASAKKLLAAITSLSTDRLVFNGMKLVLLLTAEDRDEATRLLDIIVHRDFDPTDSPVVSELAGVLIHKGRHDMALTLLEHELSAGHHQKSWESSLKSLLLVCYQAAGDQKKAKALLDEKFAELRQRPASTANPQNDWAYRIQSGLQLGGQYLRAGHRIEALTVIAWLRSLTDDQDESTGQMLSRYIVEVDRLENEVHVKLDAQTIVEIVRLEMLPPASEPGASPLAIEVLTLKSLVPDLNRTVNRTANRRGQAEDPFSVLFPKLLSGQIQEAAMKSQIQGMLDEAARLQWNGMTVRNLVIALYVAQYLKQDQHFVSAARQLDKQITAESENESKTTTQATTAQWRSLRPACWWIADVLVQLDQAELAQKVAQHAFQRMDGNPQELPLRLRWARLLTNAHQTQAAEKQMKELLDAIYPQTTSVTNQPK